MTENEQIQSVLIASGNIGLANAFAASQAEQDSAVIKLVAYQAFVSSIVGRLASPLMREKILSGIESDLAQLKSALEAF
jgi:hypothetical protein